MKVAIGAEHWVGQELSAISFQLSVESKPAQAGTEADIGSKSLADS